jgi:hypothetical protein
MKHTLRSLALTAALSAGMVAMAQQPYTVTLGGQVTGCTGNSFVNVATLPGTDPAVDIDVPVLPASCTFSITLNMANPTGGFILSTPCLGAIQTDTVLYEADPILDSAMVYVVFNCGNTTPDCLGTPGGNALPGTTCTTFLGIEGTWSADCECIPTGTSCQACFTVAQATSGGNAIPFTADLTSCSSSSSGSYILSWELPNGGAATGESTTVTFPGSGFYNVCLWMAGTDNNCVSTVCDSVFVATDGTVSMGSNVNWDCLGIPNGPNLPGTPCTHPTLGAGTWDANCFCEPDSTTTACQAGFWVMQAYTYTDTINNPGGGVEPIPNEVWVWNLSSGGDGSYQFLWNFGDGTTSTDTYPTHVYATGGPYQLCLTMVDGTGCTSTFCDTVSIDENGLYEGMRPGNGEVRSGFTLNVIAQLPTAVPTQEQLNDIALWPNPVEDMIGLSLSSTMSSNLTMDIIDLNGRVVRSTNEAVAGGRNRFEVNVSDLNAGLYMIRLTNGQQTTTRRFVKR